MVKNVFNNEQIISFDEFIFCQSKDPERALVNLVNQLFLNIPHGKYTGDASTRMISKLSRLLEHTREKSCYKGMTFRLNQFLDNVLSIEFPSQSNIKLSIYFDNECDNSIEDIEEAALFCFVNDNLEVFSGTMTDVLVRLESIL